MQTDHGIFTIKPPGREAINIDNTGVQLVYFKWLVDWQNIPSPPSCPYGRRLCIHCVNETVSFHPTQRRLKMFPIHTLYTAYMHRQEAKVNSHILLLSINIDSHFVFQQKMLIGLRFS